MKVLLLYPLTIPDGKSFFEANKFSYPLGLLYLTSVARERGHSVIVKSVHKFNVISLLKKFDPEIVGITLTTVQYPTVSEICDQIKSFDKHIKIVVGGYFPTFMFKHILAHKNSIDYIVVGEGEKTFPQLLDCLEKEEKPLKIKGVAFSHEGKVVFTGRRELIQNLDSIPFPSRDLGYSHYFMASRGCFMNCKFCCSKNFYYNTFRKRSVVNVVNELKLMEELGYKRIYFQDDCFLGDRKWLHSLLKKIRGEGFNFKFECLGRPDWFTPKILRELEKTGFEKIGVGIQNLDDNYLRFLNTGLSCMTIKKFIWLIKRSEIRFRLFYIINSGHPSETIEKIWENFQKLLELVEDNKNISIVPLILTPFPGSDLTFPLKDCNWKDFLTYRCVCGYNEMTKEEVERIYIKIVETLSQKGLLEWDKKEFSNLMRYIRKIDTLLTILTSTFPYWLKVSFLADTLRLEFKKANTIERLRLFYKYF